MEELDDQDCAFGSAFPPWLVSLTPFTPSASPSPHRLSSRFTQPAKPVRAKRQLAWISLQGRLVGAEEATSAKAVDRNGAFGAREAAAWELFTPIQRVLLVAVVAAAAVNSKKNKQIFKLQKSVEFRDQVLLSMQQKLDNLCQQVDYFKDQPQVMTAVDDFSVTKKTDCGCKPCHHHNLPTKAVAENISAKGSDGDEAFKYKTPIANVVEPEERRMSDLSDWAPSDASFIDFQVDDLTIENHIYGLKKECQQKDVTINKLSAFIQSSEVSGSKRIGELEDIIRRKNMIIKKLRKDILILEQKVMNLTRLQRPSFSAASSNVKQLPVMADNVLFDMDSTTGPSSSSDSDNSPRIRKQRPALENGEVSVQINEKASKGDQRRGQCKNSKFIEPNQKFRATSPLKERSLNQTPNSVPALKLKHTFSGENRTTMRRPTARSKEATAPKRWV